MELLLVTFSIAKLKVSCSSDLPRNWEAEQLGVRERANTPESKLVKLPDRPGSVGVTEVLRFKL